MQRSAHEVAQFGTVDKSGDTHSLTENLINIKMQENQVVASTRLIKSADEMLGTLLDIRA